MDLLIGLVLALVIGVATRSLGLDRDRALYPIVIMVIATYYLLFAVMAGSTAALVADGVIATGFVAVALAGFRLNLWWAALALAAHGAMDAVHGHIVDNPGVPSWWPGFCGAYDIAAAAWLAWRLSIGSISAKPLEHAPP